MTSSGAFLHGTVNPYGFETAYSFEYSLTTSYGESVPVPEKVSGPA